MIESRNNFGWLSVRFRVRFVLPPAAGERPLHPCRPAQKKTPIAGYCWFISQACLLQHQIADRTDGRSEDCHEDCCKRKIFASIPGTGHQGRFYADPACLTAYNKLVPKRLHDLGSIGLYVELPFADEQLDVFTQVAAHEADRSQIISGDLPDHFFEWRANRPNRL